MIPALNMYVIDARIEGNYPEGGTITDEGMTSVGWHFTKEYTAEAVPGYFIRKLTVDGEEIPVDNVYTITYTFEAVEADHEIVVEFDKIPVPHKTPEEQECYEGEDVTFTIEEDFSNLDTRVCQEVRLEDTLDSRLDPDCTVTIYDGNGVDRTDWFDVEVADHTVLIVPYELENLWQPFTFEIVTKVLERGDGQITNTAQVYFNDYEVISNPVTITVPETYVIRTSVEHGTITDDITGIHAGESRTVEYAPAEGYILSSITIDGEPADITQIPQEKMFADIDRDHEIHVVYVKEIRTLRISKKIHKSELIPEHGEPTFPFRIEGTTWDGKDVSYCGIIVFTQEEIDASDVEDMAKTITFSVPCGTYTVSEVNVLRFEFETLSVVNGTVQGESAIVNLMDEMEASCVFTNQYKRYDEFSHNSSVVNHVGETPGAQGRLDHSEEGGA